jgi:hypothetical protein
MRSVVTWAVVGALGFLSLAAAFDALRGGAGAPTASRSDPPRRGLAAIGHAISAPPPRLRRRIELRAELRRAGARGALYFTDAECRLWALELPQLDWRWKRSASAPDCRFALAPDGSSIVFGQAVWSPHGDLWAVDESRSSLIEVSSPVTGWDYRFEGSDPSFRPNGALTFTREGELWEWSDRCRPGTREVVFRGRMSIGRCARVLLNRSWTRRTLGPRLRSSLSDTAISDAVWLDELTVVVRVQGIREQVLAVVRGNDVLAAIGAFRAFGAVVPGKLGISPHGAYVTARFGADLDVLAFDRHLRTQFVPRGVGHAREIAWSPDECLAAVETGRSIVVVRLRAPARPIRLPLTVSHLAWSAEVAEHVTRGSRSSNAKIHRGFARQAPTKSMCSTPGRL